jgi:hypothetical protein
MTITVSKINYAVVVVPAGIRVTKINYAVVVAPATTRRRQIVN